MCYFSNHNHTQEIRPTKIIGYCKQYDKNLTHKIGNGTCFKGNERLCQHFHSNKHVFNTKKQVKEQINNIKKQTEKVNSNIKTTEKNNAGINYKNNIKINKLLFLMGEQYKNIDIYVDASFIDKHYIAKCGIYIKLNNNVIYSDRIIIEAKDSHEAECKAIYTALNLIYDFVAYQYEHINVNVYSDSESLVLQCYGISKIRDTNLHMIIDRIIEIKNHLCANLNWIPRKFNYIADALSRC